MFAKTRMVIIAMLIGAEAQHIQKADNADADDKAVDNIVSLMVDKLFDRFTSALTLSASPAEGFDNTTLGKTSLATQPSMVQQAALKVPAIRGSAMQPRGFAPNEYMPGPLGGQVHMPGHHCMRAVVVNADVATGPKKKKGYKIVDGEYIPFNLFSPRAPLTAKVVANKVHPHTLTGNTGDPNWETVHVTFDHKGEFPYLEGMSLGVVSPGPDKTGKTPAAIRLYSIASSAVGDSEDSKTVSLCVKRVVEVDGKFANREVGEDKPDKAGTHYPDNKVYRGVCSNYLCDLKVGDDVLITGPVGTEMLLPKDPESVIIMLATGTGIAPMRSYLRLLFADKAGEAPDGSRKFKGLAWLFMGVPYSASNLYDDENQEYKKNFPDQYRYEYAISREQKNAAGQKMYIQTRLAEYANEVWDLLQMPKTHVYMCGLKGMESGMAEALGPIAESKGLVWAELVKEWKKADRWHVEVY